LLARGQRFDIHLPIGAMIEVPAAAICAPSFARHVDFLSIGTNDLIQYTWPSTGIDDTVNYLYDPSIRGCYSFIQHDHPGPARKARIQVSLCGEMAGDPRYTRLLLGMGLTEFSMHPNNLLEVKQMIRNSDLSRLSPIARTAAATTDAGTAGAVVANHHRSLVPLDDLIHAHPAWFSPCQRE